MVPFVATATCDKLEASVSGPGYATLPKTAFCAGEQPRTGLCALGHGDVSTDAVAGGPISSHISRAGRPAHPVHSARVAFAPHSIDLRSPDCSGGLVSQVQLAALAVPGSTCMHTLRGVHACTTPTLVIRCACCVNIGRNAGLGKNKQNACAGDDGGPILQGKGKAATLVGIGSLVSSAYRKCGQASYNYGGYTSIMAMRPWLDAQFKALKV